MTYYVFIAFFEVQVIRQTNNLPKINRSPVTERERTCIDRRVVCRLWWLFAISSWYNKYFTWSKFNTTMMAINEKTVDDLQFRWTKLNTGCTTTASAGIFGGFIEFHRRLAMPVAPPKCLSLHTNIIFANCDHVCCFFQFCLFCLYIHFMSMRRNCLCILVAIVAVPPFRMVLATFQISEILSYEEVRTPDLFISVSICNICWTQLTASNILLLAISSKLKPTRIKLFHGNRKRSIDAAPRRHFLNFNNPLIYVARSSWGACVRFLEFKYFT